LNSPSESDQIAASRRNDAMGQERPHCSAADRAGIDLPFDPTPDQRIDQAM
jgi:hypothetical protein